jgi:hypothetical protein
MVPKSKSVECECYGGIHFEQTHDPDGEAVRVEVTRCETCGQIPTDGDMADLVLRLLEAHAKQADA